MKKLILSSLFVLTFINSFGQSRKNELKGNVLFAPFGMANLAYERALSTHWSAQAETFISPWKSLAHNHMQIYMGNLQLRYYFTEAMNKLYIGADLGLSFYDLQKWNYLNTNKYQRGYSYLMGAVVGYQLKINDRWNFDLFLKGGNSQGHYHGYIKGTNPPVRYESHSGKYNLSGEWLPYGGGVMLSYKF